MILRRPFLKKYLILSIALFLALSLPTLFIEGTRGQALNVLAPLFKGAGKLLTSKFQEQERLEAENHLLQIEIVRLRALLDQQSKSDLIQKEMQLFASSSRRYEELKFLLGAINQAIPARVIYRDPSSWSSALWVNVGHETNGLLKHPIIQKNSPVIVGRSVVGAIDYVGSKQSRVRLISDVALKPSVRATRGLSQNMLLLDYIDPLVRHLAARVDIGLAAEERLQLIRQLEKWKEKLYCEKEGWYLAKGILQGGGTPLWRSTHPVLRGIGFNYDFADHEGPARELISGKSVDPSISVPAKPLLQVHDLLITTGMDGVFPAGLRVAEVTKIYPLREGAYTYEIEASPVVGNFDTLHTVFIIPPLGFNYEDR
jgi:cell shape-determining protein MreC